MTRINSYFPHRLIITVVFGFIHRVVGTVRVGGTVHTSNSNLDFSGKYSHGSGPSINSICFLIDWNRSSIIKRSREREGVMVVHKIVVELIESQQPHTLLSSDRAAGAKSYDCCGKKGGRCSLFFFLFPCYSWVSQNQDFHISKDTEKENPRKGIFFWMLFLVCRNGKAKDKGK